MTKKLKQEIITEKQAEALRDEVGELRAARAGLTDKRGDESRTRSHRNEGVFLWLLVFVGVLVGAVALAGAIYVVNLFWAWTLALWA